MDPFVTSQKADLQGVKYQIQERLIPYNIAFFFSNFGLDFVKPHIVAHPASRIFLVFPHFSFICCDQRQFN